MMTKAKTGVKSATGKKAAGKKGAASVKRETARPGEAEKPKKIEYICPHCGGRMNKWQVPPFNFSDGLGWGTDHLYICFNDDCKFFTNSWSHMEEQFGQDVGYRCMCHPDSGECMAIPAGSVDAMKGNILDEIQEAKDEVSIERRREAMARLTDAFMDKAVDPILETLRNEEEWPSVRLKAVQMLGDLQDLKSIDALRNMEPGHDTIRMEIEKTIDKIHRANFTRECPYCAEVIKARAKVCKHCQKEL